MSDSDPSLSPPEQTVYTDPRDAIVDMQMRALGRDLKDVKKTGLWVRNFLAGLVVAIIVAAMAVGSYREKVDNMASDVRQLSTTVRQMGERVGKLEAEVRRSSSL